MAEEKEDAACPKDLGGRKYTNQEVAAQLAKLRRGKICKSLEPLEDFPAVVEFDRSIFRDETHVFGYNELVRKPQEVDLKLLSPHAAHWYACMLRRAWVPIPEEVLEKADDYLRSLKRSAQPSHVYYRTGDPGRESFYAPHLSKNANTGVMLLRRTRELYKHGMETGFNDAGGELGLALRAKSQAKSAVRSERRAKKAGTHVVSGAKHGMAREKS